MNAVPRRRIAALGRRLRAVAETPAGDLAGDLVAVAAAIERELASAARSPKTARRRQLDVVKTHVATLEVLAQRLTWLQRGQAPGATVSMALLRDLDGRVEALETARAEVATLEALLRFTVSPRR